MDTMKGFCLAVSLLVLASTPAYAVTDTDLIKKYVRAGDRTPGEPRQCRGMIAAFSRWSDMAKEARRMVDESEGNVRRAREMQAAGQVRRKTEKHLSDTRAHLKRIEKNLAEIDTYTLKHCQSYEETPSVMETCVWSIPRLCDVETTNEEKCAGVSHIRQTSTELLSVLEQVTSFRQLNTAEREERRKTSQRLQELDRFERENCGNSSVTADKEVTLGALPVTDRSVETGRNSLAVADKEVTQEIIARCRTEWPGEATMVKHCVDQDLEALRVLNTYPKEYQPIITRCLQEWAGEYNMVKYCADQDIEAEEALSRY